MAERFWATANLSSDEELLSNLLLNLARNVGRDCTSKTSSKWLWTDRVVKVVDGLSPDAQLALPLFRTHPFSAQGH